MVVSRQQEARGPIVGNHLVHDCELSSRTHLFWKVGEFSTPESIFLKQNLTINSATAFNAFTGVATICLGTSYGVPILVNVLTGRRHTKKAAYSLGALGPVINVITIIWLVFALVIFCMPTAIPIDASTMSE